MTADFQESVCWRTARPCPMSDYTPKNKLSCQAWFRCEVAGDYVIRWRCQSSEDGELNVTTTALSLCSSQSETKELTDCPPPVVCADDMIKENQHKGSSDLSTDVILAIAVSIFACLAMLFIVISTYKYWKLKKRLRLRSQPSQYLVRDFPYPVRYHNLWGTGYHQYETDNSKKSFVSKSFGSPPPDVYFSPQDSPTFFERLLAPPRDFLDTKKEYMGSGPGSPSQVYSGSDKFKADPSVATGSFVFHCPVGGAGLSGLSGRTEGWVRHQSTHISKESDDREKSLERYHIYKGKLGKHRGHEQQKVKGNCANYKKDYSHTVSAETDISSMPHVSSIAIPSFSINAMQQTMAHNEYMSPDLHMKDDFSERFVTRKACTTDNTHEAVSHYALGVIAHASSRQHYNIKNDDHNIKSNAHQQQGMSSRNLNTISGYSSPDVISSHNFTNRFVSSGKNLYRPLIAKSASGSSINVSSVSNNNVDLSYDSFRNEHLREQAKRWAASSSTLEVGSRQKDGNKIATTSGRY